MVFVPTSIYEKFHDKPYLSSRNTELLVNFLEKACSSKKKEIDETLEKAPTGRGNPGLLIDVIFGVSLILPVVTIVILFVSQVLDWLALVLAVIAIIGLLIANLKQDKADIIYDKRFYKESWVSFYNDYFMNLHSSYFLILHDKNTDFKELINIFLNEKELETLLVVAKSFEGTFETLIETAKSLEAS